MFDVTMGRSLRARRHIRLRFFIKKFEKTNTGLHRDDGLILLKNVTARLAEKAKKDLIKALDEFELKITATANAEIVSFFDNTLNLQNWQIPTLQETKR